MFDHKDMLVLCLTSDLTLVTPDLVSSEPCGCILAQCWVCEEKEQLFGK